MTWVSFSQGTPVSRRGFVLVHDTFCDGVVPAEWDADNRPVLYETRTEAEVELADAAEMRAEGMREAHSDSEDDDRWVEAAAIHADGSLALVEQRRLFSVAVLRNVLS